MVAGVHEPAALLGDNAQAVFKLRTAIAPVRTKNVAGGALRVDAHCGCWRLRACAGERGGGSVIVKGAGGNMFGAVGEKPGAHTKYTVRGGNRHLVGGFDQLRAGHRYRIQR